MKLSPVVFLLTLFVMLRPAFAQPGSSSADRVAPAAQVQPGSSGKTFVNLLRLVQPADPAVPMTGKVRLHELLVSAAGPVALFSEAAGAGIGQAVDSPKEWGQGVAGYGRRLGNDLAYNGVRSSLTYGTSALFHEDDRYFASDKQGAWPRIGYALMSPLVARRQGRRVFSYSALAGILGASAISRAWSPPSWQNGRNISKSIGISLAGTAGLNVFREFVPDLIRHFQGR